MEEKIFDKLYGTTAAFSFKLHAKAPLDVRTVVESTIDRDALITENGAYEGMLVYVKSDKKTYCLKDVAAPTWEEIGAGNGGGAGGGTSVDVVQTTGESTTAVMSQKAVTDAIASAIDDTIATVLNTPV